MHKLKEIPRSDQQAFETVENFWNAIDQSTVDALVDDLVYRCTLVKELGVASISQCISSHVKEARDQDATDTSSVHAWTPEGDEKLLQLMEQKVRFIMAARTRLS